MKKQINLKTLLLFLVLITNAQIHANVDTIIGKKTIELGSSESDAVISMVN